MACRQARAALERRHLAMERPRVDPCGGQHDRNASLFGVGPMTENTTIGDLMANISRVLTGAGVPRPRLDARLILCHVLGVGPEVIMGYPERVVDGPTRSAVNRLVAERSRRKPLSHILGRREFWSLDLEVTPDVLTPRPDSETLIEVVLEARPDRQAPLSILDLGTGTGCLLLALLSEYPNASGLGVDISDAALRVARRNAEKVDLSHRVRFQNGDWCDGLDGPFDLVVCNPPYIRHDELPTLEPEVRLHEPLLALDGGADGLDCYRTILWQLPTVLAPDGLVILELGEGQAQAVSALAGERDFAVAANRDDLAGITRALVLSRAAPTKK